MFCEHCGNQIEDNALFCPACGKQVTRNVNNTQQNFNQQNQGYQQQAQGYQQSNQQGQPFREYQQPNSNQQGQAFQGYQQPNQQMQNSYQQNPYNNQNQFNQNQFNQGQVSETDYKFYSIISYISWIGFIVTMCSNFKNHDFVKFHVNQALWVNIFLTAFVIPFIGWIVGIFGIVCMFIGIIGASNSQMNPIPFVGNIRILN